MAERGHFTNKKGPKLGNGPNGKRTTAGGAKVSKNKNGFKK